MYKQGYVIPCKSQITGEDIFMVIWGFRNFSTNRKLTSNGKKPGMIQTAYIPESWITGNIQVTQGHKVNRATCGDCPIKDRCYVAPTLLSLLAKQTRRLVEGNNQHYEYWANTSFAERKLLKNITRLVGLRLGAYGNPSSVDYHLNFKFIDWILDKDDIPLAPYTAYDHEVLHRLDDDRFAAYKDWVMASISAPNWWGTPDKSVNYWLQNPYPDWVKVLESSMSSYCAIKPGQPLFPQQKIHCPFELGNLSSRGCSECRLCCGRQSGTRHIVDYWHGVKKNVGVGG